VPENLQYLQVLDYTPGYESLNLQMLDEYQIDLQELGLLSIKPALTPLVHNVGTTLFQKYQSNMPPDYYKNMK
jgi:hypothetical protein